MERVLLNVRRVRQKPQECAIAVAAMIASYYDPAVRYADVRKMVPKTIREQGLWTSEQAKLLNDLGFAKVTIVTADLEVMDFTWADLDDVKLLDKLKHLRAHLGRSRQSELKERVVDIIKWMEYEGCENSLKIDQDFPKWIRRYLDNNRPVGASFNWTALHRMPKRSEEGRDDITGETDNHAVVIRGYDDSNIFVVDSHHRYYKGKWGKYKNGYYKIPWERFLVNAPYGDLVLVG